jgi:signal transduction histidine kinase
LNGAQSTVRTLLRTLIVEDSAEDTLFIVRELQQSGYEVDFLQVDEAATFRAALEKPWDIVICDYNLPSFSGPAALEILAATEIDLPLLIVSGTIGEDAAVEAMRAGARDYVLKDSLRRLGPAVRRELGEARSRRARREAERALEHAQKLDSIGMLAGGIAHDFNNVLTCIIGGATLARRRARSDPALSKELDEILTEAHRGAGLVRQLLAFSRSQELRTQQINLNELVARLEGFLRRVLGVQIDFEVSFDPRISALAADVAQLEQVVMNLCINAREAMPRGGLLRIETGMAELDEVACRARPGAAPGRYVRLRITDTGAGLTPQQIEHLFEPFHSTQPSGRGNGLGLAVVYGIVRQHEGFIEVDSLEGRGTRFDVYIPSSGELEEPVQMILGAGPLGGIETILVVEDDPSVRGTLTRILESYGYRPIPARNADEAWSVFKGRWEEIDLVLIDVALPKVDGRDLYDAMVALRPAVKVLFVSGHAELGELARGARGPVELVKKPFRPDDLAAQVRRTLDVQPPAVRSLPDAD